MPPPIAPRSQGGPEAPSLLDPSVAPPRPADRLIALAPGNDLLESTPIGRSPHRHDRSGTSSAQRARRSSGARVGAPAMHACRLYRPGQEIFPWSMNRVRSVAQHSPTMQRNAPLLRRPRVQGKHFSAYLRHDRARVTSAPPSRRRWWSASSATPLLADICGHGPSALSSPTCAMRSTSMMPPGASSARGRCPGDRQRSGPGQRLDALGSVKPGQRRTRPWS